MKCPFCKGAKDRVVDSRTSGGGYIIRRRRECLSCARRFTTYERVAKMPLRVVKKDGTRVELDRNKVLSGIIKACEKRPVSAEQIEEMVTGIEAEVYSRFDKEVRSHDIGEMVMRRLRDVDKVAYVCFASVYREFEDISEFVDEVKPMLNPPV